MINLKALTLCLYQRVSCYDFQKTVTFLTLQELHHRMQDNSPYLVPAVTSTQV